MALLEDCSIVGEDRAAQLRLWLEGKYTDEETTSEWAPATLPELGYVISRCFESGEIEKARTIALAANEDNLY